VSEARAYQSGAPDDDTLYGQDPCPIRNIRQGWKGLTVPNTLAYYEHAKITAVNLFVRLGPQMRWS